MKQLLTFIKKEFHHILRDKRSMLVLLGLPVVQLLIFGFAITTETRNCNVAILDNSKDEATQNIITRIENSTYFDIDRRLSRNDQADEVFKTGRIKLAIVFQPNFQNDLLHTNKAQIQLITDASDPNQANTLANYISAIVNDYQQELNQNKDLPYTINTEIRMLYNPQLKGEYSSVPGVMGMILLLISAMMTSISIVKEKEIGTMEVLLVSPMKPSVIIVSKVIPYFIVSLINVITILLISNFVFDIPIQGSFILLSFITIIYIICSLALGILISTVTSSQQAAMIISLMGLMLPVVMLSGYAFPIANMPWILQIISNIIPAKWYIIIVKDVMIKGTGLFEIWQELIIILGMTTFFLVLSIKRFKVRLQ
ncbi:MAG: ABC transporter permease [Ignavibacteria bacterium]|nr:ABC transporter permease [Ignavibacteria bacterium]